MFFFPQMICSKIEATDELSSVHMREALHAAIEDGRLKDETADAADTALRTWLEQRQDQHDCSNSISGSSSSSCSDNDYADDHEELDALSSSDDETDGESLSDTESVKSSDSEDDKDFSSPSTSDTESDPYEFNSEYETSSSD